MLIDKFKLGLNDKLKQSASESFRLKMIKAKLDKKNHSLKLDEIDNELVHGQMQDIHNWLRNTEEIDWDVPVPFDKDEMWQQTLEKQQKSMLRGGKIVDTSITAVARSKYSDFTIAKVRNKKMEKHYHNIVDKIEVLRNSKQFEKGTGWKMKVQAESNSKLLAAIRTKQLIREHSQTKWESKFSINKSKQVRSKQSEYAIEGIRGREDFIKELGRDPSVQKMLTTEGRALSQGSSKAQLVIPAHSQQLSYNQKFVKQFKDRFVKQAQKVAERPFHHSKSAFKANKKPVVQKNLNSDLEEMRRSGTVNIRSIYADKKKQKDRNLISMMSSNMRYTGFSDHSQTTDAMQESKHGRTGMQQYKSEAANIGKIPYRTLAEQDRELSAEEQVRLTKPCVAIEYFGERDQTSFQKRNLLNSGIDLKSIYRAGNQSHMIVPVQIDDGQNELSSLEHFRLKGSQHDSRKQNRNALPKVFSTDKLEEHQGTIKHSPHRLNIHKKNLKMFSKQISPKRNDDGNKQYSIKNFKSNEINENNQLISQNEDDGSFLNLPQIPNTRSRYYDNAQSAPRLSSIRNLTDVREQYLSGELSMMEMVKSGDSQSKNDHDNQSYLSFKRHQHHKIIKASKKQRAGEERQSFPRMTRDKSGPLKEISIEAILLKDKKYLPAFAKESHRYWRNLEEDLAWEQNRKENEGRYLNRSRSSKESLSVGKEDKSDLDQPYSNR